MTQTVTLDQLIGGLERFAQLVTEHREQLSDLDSAIGDGDHGGNMARGTRAAVEKVKATEPQTIADFGSAVGMCLVSTVGGASGPLYGTLYLRFGASAGKVTELDGKALVAALQAGLDGVMARGKAKPGEKTMIDTLQPALESLKASLASGDDLVAAVRKAADAADAGRDATADLVATKGRASYLGERSKGHVDPGSASAAMLVRALSDELAG